MKNKLIKLGILVLTCSILNTSCTNEENLEVKSEFNNESKNLSTFKKNFSNIQENLNYNYSQKSEEIKSSYLAKGNVKNLSVKISQTPLMNENNSVTGRFIDIEGSIGLYVDYSNYRKEIKIYDVDNPREAHTYPMRYNEKIKSYVPDFSNLQSRASWRYVLCATSVTLAYAAACAADGPSPLLDILAFSAFTAGVATCIVDEEERQGR